MGGLGNSEATSPGLAQKAGQLYHLWGPVENENVEPIVENVSRM